MSLESPRLNILTDYPSRKLLQQDLFNGSAEHSYMSNDERVLLSYQRARAIGKEYSKEALTLSVFLSVVVQAHDLLRGELTCDGINSDLTMQDCLYLTPKFWQLHRDPIGCFDTAAISLITIQYNLGAGLLASFAKEREDLRPLIQRVLNFETSAQFLLSEINHGLDAANDETTATLLPTGEFDLHTPNMGAAKWMPPSGPVKGFTRTGMVVARLNIDGENRGLRPFIVELNDGENMYKGITSKKILYRAGSKPVDHSITIFDHVRLPSSALLGSLDTPTIKHVNFKSMTWRLGIGGLCVSTMNISGLKSAAYIAGKYSLRRLVHDQNHKLVPIINFRTQQRPILHALAHIVVLEAYADDVTKRFLEEREENVRHGLGTVFKAHSMKVIQGSMIELGDRCGAQGLFAYNQIVENQMAVRGVGIAEGDVLVISIRLASELLIGRYSLPPPSNPNSLLAKHEIGLFNEASRYLSEAKGIHRSDHFNRFVLPLCLPLIEAVGQRMAYEAAVAAKVHPYFLALFEIGAVMADMAWYVENAGMTRRGIQEMEEKALSDLFPFLEGLIKELGTGVGDYVFAPIIEEDNWGEFVGGLKSFGGCVV